MNSLQMGLMAYCALIQSEMGDGVDVRVRTIENHHYTIEAVDEGSGQPRDIPNTMITKVDARINELGLERVFSSLMSQGLCYFPIRVDSNRHGELKIQSFIKKLGYFDPLLEISTKFFFHDLSVETQRNKIKFYESDEYCFANFTNIPCPRKTRVKVGDKKLDIHANFVRFGKHRVIQTQYPQSCNAEVFWEMALTQPSNLIVDLTQVGKTGYPEYYPTVVGSEVKFRNFSVRLERKKRISRDLEICSYSVGNKVVQRLHYQGWVDHDRLPVEDIHQIIRRMGNVELPIVHCRAGVGRAGTLTTCWFLNKFERVITQSDIQEIILTGRRARGPGFVQDPVQLQAVLDFSVNKNNKYS